MIGSKVAFAVALALLATGAATYIDSVSHQPESALVRMGKDITYGDVGQIDQLPGLRNCQHALHRFSLLSFLCEREFWEVSGTTTGSLITMSLHSERSNLTS